MPKVTDAHLEARKEQIVDAAFLCFARKGFHLTTMQDICGEADLSSGAIYRYFASKEEIIRSACDASQSATNVELLGRALDEPDTRHMLQALTKAFFSHFEARDADILNRAILQLWAETAVNGPVKDSYEVRYQGTREGVLGVVREAQRRGDFNGYLDPESVVSALFALYDGFRLQKANNPSIDTQAYVHVVEALLTGSFWTGSAPPTAQVADR